MIAHQKTVKAAHYELRRQDGSLHNGLTAADIRAMAERGDLFSDDMLCREGDGRWRPASSLTGIAVQQRIAVEPPSPAPVTVRQAEPRSEPLSAIAAEPRPNPLEEVVVAAEHRANQLQTTLDRLMEQHDHLRDQATEHAATAQQLRVELQHRTAECSALEDQLQQARAISDQAHGLTQEVAQLRADSAKLSERCDTAEREAANAQGFEQRLEHTIAELRRELASTHERAAASDSEVHRLRATIDGLEAQLLQAQSENAAARGGLSRTAIDDLRRQLEAANAAAAAAESDREQLLESLSTAQSALRTSDDLRRALEKNLGTLKASASGHSAELASARQSASEAQAMLVAMAARVEGAETAADNSRRALQEQAERTRAATAAHDAAVIARDAAITDRDSALAERDSTRLAVGATQVDLLAARRDADALRQGLESARMAIADQTARACGLERSVADTQVLADGLRIERDELRASIIAGQQQVDGLRIRLAAHERDAEAMQERFHAADALTAALREERDTARVQSVQLSEELQAAHQQRADLAARVTLLEREVADARGKVVARDELIFRDSLRTEERERDNRGLQAEIAQLRADQAAQQCRAEDAAGQSAALQRDLHEARRRVAEQADELTASARRTEEFATQAEAARASLVAATRERDELSAAFASSQAAVAAREQQVAAERSLRDQAEGSSRQLLASYEKLAEETSRRIADLEVKLASAGHEVQAGLARESQAAAALGTAQSEAHSLQQKLAAAAEQRNALTRDRDSFAKRASAEAAGRAAAEDKISAAQERARQAEREGRAVQERAVQAAMIALTGARQRINEDYTKSLSEIEVLEQLVAESTRQLIAAGAQVPGIPLLPREAMAKAVADSRTAADAAALLAQVATARPTTTPASAPAAPSARYEPPAAPSGSFRMVDGLDDDSPRRPAPSRVSGAHTSGTARAGGARERVSQPRTQSSSSSSDDDSSSTAAAAVAPTQPPPALPAAAAVPASVDEHWIDEHCSVSAVEPPVQGVGITALTALGALISASIASIPLLSQMDLQRAFLHIAAWTLLIPALTHSVQRIAVSCAPVLARRIPQLAAASLLLTPLCTLFLTSQPLLGAMFLTPLLVLPWLMVYAAWPDPMLRAVATTSHVVEEILAKRERAARVAACIMLAAAAVCLLVPTAAALPPLVRLPAGMIALAALALTGLLACIGSARVWAQAAAWMALIATAAVIVQLNSTEALSPMQRSPWPWLALICSWSTVSATTLLAACTLHRFRASVERQRADTTPALISHERVFAAATMAASAFAPLLPALVGTRLAAGRSRRAEAQLRSFANFEVWSSLTLLSVGIGHLIAPLWSLDLLFAGLLLTHALLCFGCALTVGCDRFVRCPSLLPVLQPPEGALELPSPVITVQRTAEGSSQRPITHPCGTTPWALATVIVGCAAVATLTRSAEWTMLVGPLVGLAWWLPSLIAARSRHADTVIVCVLSTGLLALMAAAGAVVPFDGANDTRPLVIAACIGACGAWALLTGWAFKGMSQLATLARSSVDAALDADGDALAPSELPAVTMRREWMMRRVIIAASWIPAATALPSALPTSWAVVVTLPWLCTVIAALLCGAITLIATRCDRDQLIARTTQFARTLALASVLAVLPLFFAASQFGALEAVLSQPWSALTALTALLAAGVLWALRPAPPSAEEVRAVRARARRHSAIAMRSQQCRTPEEALA
jgi:hypothetical protein